MRRIDEIFICDVCGKEIPKYSGDTTGGRISMIRFDIYGKDDCGRSITIHICDVCSPKIGIQKDSELGCRVSEDFVLF